MAAGCRQAINAPATQSSILPLNQPQKRLLSALPDKSLAERELPYLDTTRTLRRAPAAIKTRPTLSWTLVFANLHHRASKCNYLDHYFDDFILCSRSAAGLRVNPGPLETAKSLRLARAPA